jgi:two-component system, cell cycle response regulator
VPLPGSPQRAPIGAVATVRARLARQRPRPFLVRFYAATLGDGGVLGAPARRRWRRAVVRSLLAAVTVAIAGLLVLRVFEGVARGWAPSVALLVLAVALAAAVWRRADRGARGVAASYREQLELGGLFVVGAYAVLQSAGGGPGESPLQPVVYLVMAFLVAFLARGVGFGLVVFAAGLEFAIWWGRGARGGELPAALAHAGFLALFALLYHAVLTAQMTAARRAEKSAVACRLEEITQRAREFRLLAPGAAGAAQGDALERAQRWTEASVVEVEAAVRGVLEVAEVALRSHTCAYFTLSADDAWLSLRECRSSSDAVTRAPLPAGEGALGGAVKRLAPVRLHGDVKAVNYYGDGTRPGALLAVPLVDRRGGFVRGVVVADRLEPVAFTDEDERLLTTLSGELLRAAEAERLLGDMKRTRDEKDRFYKAIEQLNRTTKPSDVFETALRVAGEIAQVDFSAVTIVEEEDGKRRHRVVRTSGGDEGRPSRIDGLLFPDDTGLVVSAVRRNAILPEAKDIDVAKAVVFDAATRLKGMASVKVIPLRAGENVLGTLVLGSRRAGVYDLEAVEQLRVIAMQAGDALLRARLFDETERLATTDGLTGLVNHRTFQTRLDEHVLAAERYGKKLSLLLCDIDHFKSVNDTYGHPVGDQVLRAVARTLANEARGTDVVARYGGEEFAVVMPETDTGGALVIAERIRERVGALVLETEQGPLRVTMSLGVATFPEDAARKAGLVERADGCLYHAKRHGRNQSVAAASLRHPHRVAG